jgi:LysM repeat protein
LIAEVVAATLVGVIGTAAGAPARLRPQPMLLCVLAAGGAMVLAACGSDSRDAASSTTMPSRTTVAPTTTTAAPVTYQVKRGDTLTSIAAFFGLSNATLAEANQLGNQDQLTEGQILVIPPTPPPQVTVTPDVGHAGDTFTLTLTGAKADETITFEIDGPGPGTFTGSPHKASPEGGVTARYQSSGDDPGKYTVVASGDRGTSARASYRLLE